MKQIHGVMLSVSLAIRPGVSAQTPQKPVASATVVRGEVTFRDHCAVCHGKYGKGDGPVAEALTPRPTDLAGLTKRKGTFPAAQITAALKGTDPVIAHGVSTMRIWGAFFSADAKGDQKQADRRIADVVEFIQSIQEK